MDIPEKIKAVASAALEAAEVLLPQWLPDGQRQGSEWVAPNPVRGDRRAGSFSVSLSSGRYNDFADDEARGGDLVALFAYLLGISQLAAARRIDSELGLGFFSSTDARMKNLANVHKAAKVRQRHEARQRQKTQNDAAAHAQKVWPTAAPAQENHPYLIAKSIPPLTLREQDGDLLVPLFDGRQLRNLQRIRRNGEKRFLSGGRVRSCYAPLGKLSADIPLYVCEGWATGATLHLHTGAPVACAMNASNLVCVAESFRERYGNKVEIIIAGDDDRNTKGNPGRKAALDAAKTAGSLVVFPEWPAGAPDSLSDFNDLHVWLTQLEDSHEQIQAVEQ